MPVLPPSLLWLSPTFLPLFLCAQYWVDPNAGDPKDAILVHCDMEATPHPATCIRAKPEASEEVAFATGQREVWFSDIPQQEGGFRPTYKADSNQITFLQMLSSKASTHLLYRMSDAANDN